MNWMQAAGFAADAGGGLMSMGAQNRANRQSKRMFQGALANTANAGALARQDAGEQFGNAQANLVHRNAQRGLTGTTAWDSALNNVMAGRSKAMSAINQDEANAKNQIMGQYSETVSPNNWATGLAGVLGKMGNLKAMGGVDGQDGVTQGRVNGKEAEARMDGGGNVFDDLLRRLGLK